MEKEQANFIKNYLKSNLQDWTCEDVIVWLTNEIGPNYNDYFSAHEITGRDLLDLNEDNLKNDLKVLKLHDRKKIMRKICELMRMIIDNSGGEVDTLGNIGTIGSCGIQSTKQEANNRGLINIVYKGEAVKFKCTKGNKIYNIIQDCVDIFGLGRGNIANVLLTDKNGFVLPRDSLLIDCLNEDESPETNLYIVLNKKDLGLNASNENLQSLTNTLSDKYAQSSKNKSSILQETAIKNKFLSFEALDNFEKNGYSFTVKKGLNKAQESDKVTINSFYNISNLNNFEKSMFNSTAGKHSNYLEGSAENVPKTKKKGGKFTCIRSKKKIDIEDLSEELDSGAAAVKTAGVTELIKITDYQNYENNPPVGKKLSNSLHRHNISQDSNNLNYKNNYFDRLYNYYNDANKIKTAGGGRINETETENEIHNFLRSLKSKKFIKFRVVYVYDTT
jgi:hypothetical protein